MSEEETAIEKQIKDYRLRLGDRIRIVREERGYSQEKLAELMNVNRSTISKIENGKFSITVDYLVKFSICLDYEFKVVEKQDMDRLTTEQRRKNMQAVRATGSKIENILAKALNIQ